MNCTEAITAMGKLIDLTGQRFGRLTVVGRSFVRKGQLFWTCRCDCGNICDVQGSSLRGGRTSSCGCLHDEMACERLRVNDYYRHGESGVTDAKLYRVWVNMKQRCYNPKSPEYHNYGERGISVCHEWVNDFTTFMHWAEENGYRQGLSIERIDNNANYSPENCRWATSRDQSNNQRKTVFLTYNGETKPLSFLAEEHGLTRELVKHRLMRGWTIERALTEPVHSKTKSSRES